MTDAELNEVLNALYLVYPSMFKNIEDPRRRERYVRWYNDQIGDLDAIDCLNGLKKYNRSEQGKYNPSVYDIINYAKAEKRKRLAGSANRRLVTEDEEMYNLYLKEMRKPAEKRDEWLIQRCLPSCEIMTNPEAYKAKYGKYREEFEKL